ncbi:MAG: helix-turn-helix domain-containing protein [Pseudomonadota bacterium]
MHTEYGTERALDLMREGATYILSSESDWRDQLQQDVSDAFDTGDDPSAAITIQRSNFLSIAHWATSIAANPAGQVDPFIDPALRLLIREQIRLGTPETILNGYRAAQIVAWRAWMQVTFNLTSDKAELEALLDISSKRINDFSQRSVDRLADMIEEERAEFARRSPDRQYETTRDILAGLIRDPQKASHMLGYRLNGSHQALIIFRRQPEGQAEELEAITDKIELAVASKSALRIAAKSSVAWLWLPSPISKAALMDWVPDGFGIAVGCVRDGFAGFKDSHESARVTQRVMARSKQSRSVVAYDEIALAHLLIEQDGFSQFTKATLGRLLDDSGDILNSLRVYLSEGSNAAKAAKALGLHRNTLNKHLERANDLLPTPLDASNRLMVGAALDALHWS